LTGQSDEDIFELLFASDELLLEELFIHVQDYLIEIRTDWVHENFILVLDAVFKLDNYKKLRDYCLSSFCEDPIPFLSSKAFPSINEEILLCLLNRNDLQIKEIVIWDYLIKWGIEQTPSLGCENSDRTKWNKENYEALKETLYHFIPLIRFVCISRRDFKDKVIPYNTIIPSHIYKEIEEFHYKDALPKTLTLSPRTGFITRIVKFKSNIITPKLAKIIINWIEKKNVVYNRIESDPLYNFKLIYRGSRDGISSGSFRKKCNGRIASLVLVKVKESKRIFGGYSSIGFSSLGDGYIVKDNFRLYHSLDNFIFSFEDSKDTQNMKISRVVNKSQAILDYCSTGFNFGWGSLSMNETRLHANNNSKNYENNLDTSTIYTIEDVETFTIRKTVCTAPDFLPPPIT
jgi:hypothetical protein